MILALDLSSTSTGVCLDGETSTITPKGMLIERARAMRDEIRHLLIPAPDLVIIEAIGTRHVQTAIAIATVHALILDECHGYAPVLAVPPASLKKWALGKGGGKGTDKDAMLVAGIKAGSAAETNDEMDAWWLWTIGDALVNGRWEVPCTGYRTDVLQGLSWEKAA